MSLLRTGPRVLLLTLVVLTGLLGVAPGRTAAQAGATSFTSPMTGIPIQTSAPWSVDTASVMSEDGVESITIDGEYEFMQLWFLPGNVDLVEARDVVLDSFAQTFGTFVEIDRGAYGNVSYSLDITSAEGMEFGVFSLFLGQRDSGYVEYYVFFGALSLFAQGLTSAQQHVTVNGTPVFGGVDGTGLQNLLLANAGVTGTSTTTTTQAPPVPTPAPSQPSQPPAQPTQVPQQPTTTTGTLTPEQSAYIQTIRGETTTLAGSLDQFVTSFVSIADGSATNPDQTIADLNTILDMWASYPQTASQNVAPAGMEEIGTAYQQLASDLAALSDQFRAYADLAANSDPGADEALDLFLTQLEATYGSVDSLNSLLDQYEAAGSTTTTTTQPTQAPVETPTATTSTDAADGEAYLQTIADETQAIQDSITSFAEGVQLLGSSNSAEQDEGFDMVNDAVNYWATYDQIAAGIVAPAGYEDVDAAYRQLATDVVSLATLFQTWLDAPDATADAASAEFTTALDAVQAEIAALQQMVGTGGQTATTTSPTEQPQDTGGDITETGKRGQLPPVPGSNQPQDTGSRTGGSDADLGLVSDGEYVSPQLGLTIIWDDRWTFESEYIEDAIGSNEDTGEDWVTLVWTTGTEGDITMTVAEASNFSPADAVAYWESDEYLSRFDMPSEVVLSDASDDRGGVVIRLGESGDELVLYQEAVCLSRRCDEVAYVMIISAVDDTADILADAEDGIEIEGEPATGVFSTREINRALDQ